MTDYTVQAQYSTDNEATWTAIAERENLDHTDPDTRITDPAQFLEDVADNYADAEMPAGAVWRIGLWPGLDADTSGEPEFVVGPWTISNEVRTPGQVYEEDLEALGQTLGREISPESLLKELAENRNMRLALEERRDTVIRILMKTDTKRGKIAAAAGVSEPRLYQVRDNR